MASWPSVTATATIRGLGRRAVVRPWRKSSGKNALGPQSINIVIVISPVNAMSPFRACPMRLEATKSSWDENCPAARTVSMNSVNLSWVQGRSRVPNGYEGGPLFFSLVLSVQYAESSVRDAVVPKAS